MKILISILMLFVNLSYAENIAVVVSKDKAKATILSSGEEISLRLGESFFVKKMEYYEESSTNILIYPGEERVDKQYITPITEFKVVNAYNYFDTCLYYTVGGEGDGHYMKPLPDGGVLIYSDYYQPYRNMGVWKIKELHSTYSFGNLLVKDNLAIFRDGFGEVFSGTPVENGGLVYFSKNYISEFYSRVDCSGFFPN